MEDANDIAASVQNAIEQLDETSAQPPPEYVALVEQAIDSGDVEGMRGLDALNESDLDQFLKSTDLPDENDVDDAPSSGSDHSMASDDASETCSGSGADGECHDGKHRSDSLAMAVPVRVKQEPVDDTTDSEVPGVLRTVVASPPRTTWLEPWNDGTVGRKRRRERRRDVDGGTHPALSKRRRVTDRYEESEESGSSLSDDVPNESEDSEMNQYYDDATQCTEPERARLTQRELMDRYWSRFRTTNKPSEPKERDPDEGLPMATIDDVYVNDPVDTSFCTMLGMFGHEPAKALRTILKGKFVRFVNIEHQYTTIRGRLETLKQYALDAVVAHVRENEGIQQQVAEFDNERARRVAQGGMGGVGNESDTDDNDDLQSNGRRAFAANSTAVELLRQFSNTTNDRIEAAKEQLEVATSQSRQTTLSLSGAREYRPTENSVLKEMRIMREERLRRDNLHNIVRARASCPICLMFGANHTTSDLNSDTTIAFFALWADLSTLRCKETAWVQLAEFWNTRLVDSKTRHGHRAEVPRLTPSHMDIHFTECNVAEVIPGMVDDLCALECMHECIKRNGVFMEEVISGVKTNNNSVSKVGCATMLRLIESKSKLAAKIATYNMLAKFLAGTAVAPMPSMMCMHKNLDLATVLSSRPRKNEASEKAANRVMAKLVNIK